MKAIVTRISLIISVILILSSSALAVPQLINYQGSLSDSSGPVNGDVSITFTIYNAATAGDVLWSETQTVSVTDGVFNVLLGSQTPFPADLFSGDERYLGVQVDSDPEMTPRQQLASVPYALGAPPVCSPGDFVNCYTGPDGTLGVGECKTGERTCNPSGTGFFGTCEDEVTPLEETCDGLDNDCNPATEDGSQDPSLGDPCDGPDSDLCVEGTTDCTGGALGCTDLTGSTVDTCNGADDDCDPASADGSEDPLLGVPCDGSDTDLCPEGIYSDCVAGVLTCSDTTGSNPDICDGVDNDCNPSTADGSQDPSMGNSCDGPDSDLCEEGTYTSCSGGVLACSDSTGSTIDVCNGLDDDCDPASADGSEDSLMGLPCDGADADLCQEGTYTDCIGGERICSDTSGNTPDLCDGDTNDDCNPATADGSGEPTLYAPCDGPDTDLCNEGIIDCAGVGGLECSDSTGDTLDLCNGDTNDDCNAATADGSDEPTIDNLCDGPDSDLCTEGTIICMGAGGLECSDSTGDTLDTCNGVDDDCNAATADGSDEPTIDNLCDGPDSDLCTEGTIVCTGAGGLVCNDSTGDTLDLCNGDTNDDCNPATADGSDEPTLGDLCDGADSDLCREGNLYCAGASGLLCDDSTGNNLDLCDGDTNDDCNLATADGSDEPTLGDPCDGPDSDLCNEGNVYCAGAGGLSCNDSTGDSIEVCGDSIDNDCDGDTDEGCYAQPSSAGDLVITELMIDPFYLNDSEGEWFELYNPTGGDLTLLNCVLSDYDTDSHTITSEVLVYSYGYATLAISNTPGFIPDYVYTGFNLGNSGDEAILTCGGVVIDEVQYDTVFDASGASKALLSDSLDAVSNDTLSNWYNSITPYSSGDLGTPGTANEY